MRNFLHILNKINISFNFKKIKNSNDKQANHFYPPFSSILLYSFTSKNIIQAQR